MKNKRLVVVAGPTGVGKTGVSVALAEWSQSEIISADARQFYKEMVVGTAQPSENELSRVKHHFVGSASIVNPLNAAYYGDQARHLISDLLATRDIVFVCGGSGLYLKALLEGFDEIPEIPTEVREQLNEAYRQNGLEWLRREVSEKDPASFKKIDQQNPRRLLRVLEVLTSTGKSMTAFHGKKNPTQLSYQVIKIGLDLAKGKLHEKISQRVDEMMVMGLLEEVKKLYSYRELPALQTVGYQELFDFIDHKYSLDEAVELIKSNTRKYAKRQMTWFRKDDEIRWFDPVDLEEMKAFISSK